MTNEEFEALKPGDTVWYVWLRVAHPRSTHTGIAPGDFVYMPEENDAAVD